MLNKLKNLFAKPEPVKIQEPIKEPKKPRKPREPKPKVELTEKDIATQKGEPYVNILKLNIDPNDINSGEFELDWNDKFIINLIKAGYKMNEKDSDSDIVDRWFQQVCRNVLMEIYEQAQADPENRMLRKVSTKDLGNGKTEVS